MQGRIGRKHEEDFAGILTAAMLLCVGATTVLAAETPHFFYINKDGNDFWFVEEVAGAKAEAEKLGAQFTSQNVEFDSNLHHSCDRHGHRRTTLRASSLSSLSKRSGPAVLKKARDAGIPMIAVDDTIKDEAGKDAALRWFFLGCYRQAGRRGHRGHG